MSKSEEYDVTDFLTEGSVWLRKKGKLKGQEVMLLHLTNVPLIETSAAEDHPVRVVYANAKGEIYDRTVDEFCDVYRFHHVDGKLEARLDGLLAFDESEDEDDQEEEEAEDGDSDDDGDAIDTAFGASTTQPEADAAPAKRGTFADTLLDDLRRDDTVKPTLGMKFTLSNIEGYAKPTLTAEDLEHALESYVQEPAWSHGLLAHRLIFRLGGKVTIDSLREVFEPSGAADTVASFNGLISGMDIDVTWTTWIGVFPEAFHGQQYAAVHVGTEYSAEGNDEEPTDDTPEESDATDAAPADTQPAEGGPATPAPNDVSQQETPIAAAQPTVASAEAAPVVAQPQAQVEVQAASSAPASLNVTPAVSQQ